MFRGVVNKDSVMQATGPAVYGLCVDFLWRVMKSDAFALLVLF